MGNKRRAYMKPPAQHPKLFGVDNIFIVKRSPLRPELPTKFETNNSNVVTWQILEKSPTVLGIIFTERYFTIPV